MSKKRHFSTFRVSFKLKKVKEKIYLRYTSNYNKIICSNS